MDPRCPPVSLHEIFSCRIKTHCVITHKSLPSRHGYDGSAWDNVCSSSSQWDPLHRWHHYSRLVILIGVGGAYPFLWRKSHCSEAAEGRAPLKTDYMSVDKRLCLHFTPEWVKSVIIFRPFFFFSLFALASHVTQDKMLAPTPWAGGRQGSLHVSANCRQSANCICNEDDDTSLQRKSKQC